MKKITVEKYIDGELKEKKTIPAVIVSILNKLLPSYGIDSLKSYGFNLDEIIQASKNNATYKVEKDIKEDGVIKRIVITI